MKSKIQLKAVNLFEKYSWILGVAILIYGISIYVNTKKDLYSNQAETHGVIYDITSMRAATFSGIVYKYKFKYNEKEYFGTTTKNYSERIKNGRIFKVIFSTENPNNNEIFFEYEYLRKTYLDKNGNRKTIYLKKH